MQKKKKREKKDHYREKQTYEILLFQASHFTPQRRHCQRHFRNMVKLLKVNKQILSSLLDIVRLHVFSLTLFYLSAKIVTDRVSDRSKGFGFVTYASEDEAEKALQEMNGKVCPYYRCICF